MAQAEPYTTAIRRMSPGLIKAVTAHDTNPIATGFVASAIRVAVGGNISVIDTASVTTVITALADGETIVGQITHVKSTGTTATGITAFGHLVDTAS